MTKKGKENMLHLGRDKIINNIHKASLNHQSTRIILETDIVTSCSCDHESRNCDIQSYNTQGNKHEKMKKTPAINGMPKKLYAQFNRILSVKCYPLNIQKTAFVSAHMTIFKTHFQF